MLIPLFVAAALLFYRYACPPWPVDLFHIQYAAYQWHVGAPQWIYSTYAHYWEWDARYTAIAAAHGLTDTVNMHYYAPFLSRLLAPLSDVDAAWWTWPVYLLNYALLPVLAWQMLRLCRIDYSRRYLAWGLALATLNYPMAVAVKVVQIGPLLIVALWAAFLMLRRGNQWGAGALIGLVATIKLYPLALLFYPALRKEWKTVISGLAVFSSVFALSWLWLGPDIHARWIEAVQDLGKTVWPYAGNQSLSGWYARAILGHSPKEIPFTSILDTELVRRAGELIFGGGAALLLWIRRRQLNDGNFAPALGLLVSGMVLSLGIAWEHYLLFVLPPLAWAIREAWQGRDSGFGQLLLLVAAFFYLAPLRHFYVHTTLGGWMSGSQVFGLILLWIWFARRIWSGNASAFDSSRAVVGAAA